MVVLNARPRRRSWHCSSPPRSSPERPSSRPVPDGHPASPQKEEERSPDEKNPQYQYEMGVIALRYGLPDEAIRYGQLAVSLDPGHFDGWNLLGLGLFRQRRLRQCR